MKKIAFLSLQMAQAKLADLGIAVDISVVREGTLGEYHMILLRDENYIIAMQNLEKVKKDIEGNSSDLVLEIGSTRLSLILEIRPRYSYLLESEIKQLSIQL